MSFPPAPHSPPETPQKNTTMAVEQGDITPKAQSSTSSRDSELEPPAESPSQSAQTPKAQSFEASLSHATQEPLASLAKVHQSRAQPEVQVLSTLPPADFEEAPIPQKVSKPEHNDLDPSEAATEEDEDRAEQSTPASSNPDEPLPLMDWDEFDARYRQAMVEANKVEDDLLKEFDRYVDAFGNWAVAPAALDNERGWKRMKTRQRFVELSETKLKEKQQHYSKVVDAFKLALELLKG